MNFIFISPAFPQDFWNFCDRLHKRGVNVLGIGDTPYDELDWRLKESLTEYYKVDSLEDYDQVFRAVAFLSFKHGKIDWLESNNEYWLRQDAQLRTDFNITTGVQNDQIDFIKEKSMMKKIYLEAGIPTARQHVVTDSIEETRKFIELVGYPVIMKPDTGVGATDTYKLENDAELESFYENLPAVPYVSEEFITGDICSYDAILDSNCEPVFESMTVWPPSIMDIVEKQLDLSYYTAAEVPEQLKDLGRRTVKAFGVKSRFVHLEFFRLTKAKPGLGEVGDFAGLEVNMRPAGGFTPDMMNYAHATDVYSIWADMVTADKRLLADSGDHEFCVYASRRDIYEYEHTHQEIMEKYGVDMVMQQEMPQMYWPQMGRYMYCARLKTEAEVQRFIHFVQDK